MKNMSDKNDSGDLLLDLSGIDTDIPVQSGYCWVFFSGKRSLSDFSSKGEVFLKNNGS